MRREVRVSDGHGPYRGWEDATMYVQCDGARSIGN